MLWDNNTNNNKKYRILSDSLLSCGGQYVQVHCFISVHACFSMLMYVFVYVVMWCVIVKSAAVLAES